MNDHAKNSKKEELKKSVETESSIPASGDEMTPNDAAGMTGNATETEATTSSDTGDASAATNKLSALAAENAELKDRFLRKYAEFENYKKRINREREESAKYSNSMLLLDVATVIDDFERALKSAEESKDFATLHSGISMIEKRLVSILEKKWGLERFFAKGAVFDPERHEALMAEQSNEVEQPMVGEDFQSGYTLHGKVLRPAKVKVIQPAGETTTDVNNNANRS